jgi:hypothetical protein
MSSIPRVSSTSSELNDFTDDNGKKIYNVSKSRLMSLVNWVLVFKLFIPILWYVVVGVLVIQVGKVLIDMKFDVQVSHDDVGLFVHPKLLLQ